MYFDRRLWGLTAGCRGRIVFAVVLGLATAAAGVARLALLGWLLGRLFAGAAPADLTAPFAAVVAVVALRAMLQYHKETVAYRTAAAVQRRLRDRLYGQVLALGPAYFDGQRTGGSAGTLVDSVEQLETFFGQYLPQLFTAALTPIGIAAFMAFLDLPTAAIYLGFAFATLVAPAMFHRANARASLARKDAYSSFASDFLDAVQGLPTLKAFGQSTARADQLEHRAFAVFRTTMRVLVTNAATHGMTVAGIAVGAAVALVVGGARVADGQLDLEILLVILMLGVEVFRPLRELSQLFHQGLTGLAAAGAVFELLDAQPAVVAGDDAIGDVPRLTSQAPAVELRDVTFAYPGGRRNALEDVTLSVRAGERVAIVGPSGAGKSTIIALLQRWYDPDHGGVRVGGRQVTELTFDALRATMGLVAQDTHLFHGSVADNLRVGDPHADADRLAWAARAANIAGVIEALPEGYDTVVGERGVRLSGGERQRIAIARALLRDAPLLVLDEALSSVDAENEATIQAALERLMEGRTTLVVAHRLSSVVNCDRIIVLDEGRVVQEGDHASLVVTDGPYRRLFADQLADVEPDPLLPESAPIEVDGRIPTTQTPTDGDAIRELPGWSTPTPAMVAAEQMGWVTACGRLLGVVGSLWPKVIVAFVAGVGHFSGLIGVSIVGALMVAAVQQGRAASLLMLWLLVLAPLTAVLTWLESWVSHDVAFRLLAHMRVDLFRKLDALAPGYLHRRRSGDLVAVATQDVETVEYFFAHTIANAFVALVVPAAVVATLIAHDPSLGWVIAPFLALAAWSPVITRRAVDRLGTSARRQLGALSAHAVDTLQGLREIAAFQLGARRRQDFLRLLDAYGPIRVAFNRQITVQRIVLEMLIGLGGLAVLVAGAAAVTTGRLAADRLPLLTLIAMGAFLPISELSQVGRRLGDTLGATRRLAAVDLEPIPVTDGPADVVPADGTARLRAVRFAYPGTARSALADVDLEIAASSTVALVGPSGAGKSTLAALVMRFWDPDEGQVEVGGHDVRRYRLDDLRRHVALVAQDTYLFNASLRDNLLIARPEADDEALDAAVAAAGLADFVGRLPDGLATMVGERGTQLSGGQRQRVAIGRAMLRDAPVLVLDEATSHLDTVTERHVRDALDRLQIGRTTIVIAHRLSTVRNADLVVVLDRGRIVEQGTHDQLVANRGPYATLVGRQRAAVMPRA